MTELRFKVAQDVFYKIEGAKQTIETLKSVNSGSKIRLMVDGVSIPLTYIIRHMLIDLAESEMEKELKALEEDFERL